MTSTKHIALSHKLQDDSICLLKLIAFCLLLNAPV